MGKYIKKDKQLADGLPSNEKSLKEQQYAQEVAKKVNYLFSSYEKAAGRRYTYNEVASSSNGLIDDSWISKMASGQSSRPGLPAIQALTEFFGPLSNGRIDARFWFKNLEDWLLEQDERQESPTSANAEITTTISSVLTPVYIARATSLSETDQQTIADLIAFLEQRRSHHIDSMPDANNPGTD